MPKLTISVSPHIAIALGTIAANQGKGDNKFSRKFTPERCAAEMLEVKVIEIFKELTGASPGEYFACERRVHHAQLHGHSGD